MLPVNAFTLMVLLIILMSSTELMAMLLITIIAINEFDLSEFLIIE